MEDTSGSVNVSTKLQRIAELASKAPSMVMTTLAHNIDMEFMREAYRRTRKDGATGVDNQTAEEFEKDLEENLGALLEGLKSGTYKAPPVKRKYIPKGDGKSKRPIGIPTLADKVLQKAVQMILEAIYEQDFCDCSFGFRPGRSAHDAIKAVWSGLMQMGGGWVIDADIKSYFDTIDHGCLREMLDQRVRDGVLRRVIDKWMKAGVFEEGNTTYPEQGTPQGGVISPILANIYLHHVLDQWFEKTVKPLLTGRGFMVRYADDFIIVLETENDAKRVMKVLPKRFEKYGLKIHPEKTKIVKFKRPEISAKPDKNRNNQGPATSFNLLGFTHYWGRSKKGYWVVKRKTATDRKRRTLMKLALWCRKNRHMKIRQQWRKLCVSLVGHYRYFGINGNARSLQELRTQVERTWKKWLDRRSHKARKNWEQFRQLLKRYPLPPPKIYHSDV